MAIRKESATALVHRRAPYEVVCRDVVQSLTDPVALAIHTYLLTLPDDWKVRRQQIMDHFEGLGRKRFDSAMQTLRERGLIWDEFVRGDDGRIEARELVVSTTPAVKDLPESLGHENDNKAPTSGHENDNEVKPSCGKGDHLHRPIDLQRQIELQRQIKHNARERAGCADIEFDDIWQSYPRKTAKPAARKAYRKARKEAGHDLRPLIARDLERRAREGEWREKQFIPHLSTYLNQTRWEDESLQRSELDIIAETQQQLDRISHTPKDWFEEV